MYLSMWILSDSIKGASVDRHIASGEMSIRNASVLLEAGRYKAHTVYVTYAEGADPADSKDIMCINRNDYFTVQGLSLEEVYEQIQDAIDRYEEWDLHMRDRIEEHCSMQEIADRASDIMQSMIGIMNTGFIMQVVAGKQYAPHIPEQDLQKLQPHTGLPIAHVNTYSAFLKDHLDDKTPYLFTEPVVGSLSVTKNILLNGWLWGFCFFAVDSPDVPESRMQLFQVFYEQLLRWNDTNGLNADRSEQETVFLDLLAGTPRQSEEKTWEYLNRLGWMQSDEKYVCVLREHYGNNLVYLRLIHQISGTFPQYQVLQLQDMIAILVNSTALPIDALTAQLPQILAGSNIHTGISYPFRDLFHLPQYLEQAQIALENAQQRNIPVSYCSDCIISYTRNLILKEQSVNMELPVIKQIRRYDGIHGTQLYLTLRTYIMEERSLQRTAEELSIHKNTLLYRLKRLQELFPLNLSESEERMRIILSLLIYSPE